MGVLEGELPPKATALVVEWALNHKNELIKDWELAQINQKPLKIEPLK